MKVVVFVEDVLGVPFRVTREIALEHIRAGDEVHLIVCDGSLQTCPANNYGDRFKCMMCRSRRNRAISGSDLRHAIQHVLDLSEYEDALRIPEFDTIEDVKAYCRNGINFGMEAASTVISALRDPRPDLNRHQPLVRRSLFTSIATYLELNRLVGEITPDQMYVLNGRRASQMPLVRVAQKRNIPLSTYEVGHNTEKGYVLIEGTYFHSLTNIKSEIEAYWSEVVDQEAATELAETFFLERRYGSGKEFIEAQFTDDQEAGLLPEGFNPDARNVAIFNSSEDEFAAVEGYGNPVYADQISALPEIIKDPRLDPEITFYLRSHPNLRTIENYQTRALKNLSAPNFRLIPPDSPIDTYALMDACDVALSFGSTMGIESAFFGTPSVVVGRVPYEDLGACYIPTSHEEVVRLLNDKNLHPRDPEGALMYGYYMTARDHEFKHIPNGPGSLCGGPRPSASTRYMYMASKEGPLQLVKYLSKRAVSRMRRTSSETGA